MEFDAVYNVHCSLRVISGREITLDKLTQSRTYAGLLLGTPNKKSNDNLIQSAMDRARQDPASFGEPLLIDPERRDYFRQRGDMQSVFDRQQDRPEEFKQVPEWLLQVECVGVFNSIRPARDTTKDASSLTIVWYQDDFGFDQRAIERLRLVEWDQNATDWEY